jgi:hypothetical protein
MKKKVTSCVSKLPQQLEKSLDKKGVFLLAGKNGKVIHVYPHRLAYIDGRLNLIAEVCSLRGLNSFNVSEIAQFKKTRRKYEPNFTKKAVDHFMAQIRAVNGNEVRLVLKVVSGSNISLLPQYHYFRRPYVAANSQGDLIWGGWVEISPELFKWLYEIRSKINILDPESVRKAFQRYCQRLQAQDNLKKAG